MEKKMSECNYCRYKSIKARKPKGYHIVKRSDPFHIWGAGIRIYMIPKEKKIKELSKEELEEYFRCWYAELPERCVC